MPSDPLFGAPRRLHVAAAVAHSAVALRGAALPVLGIVVLGGTSGVGRAVAWAVVGALLALGTGIVRWRTTTYWLDGGALRFESGVLSPDDIAIPIGRIQAIDSVQGPVQRLFGVAELHVQTPGGGSDAEIVLSAVSPADARALRAALGHPEPAAPTARVRLGVGRLVLAALTAPRFAVVLPVVGAAVASANDLLSSGAERGVIARVDSMGAAVRLAAVILAAAFAVSFAGALVAFAGFEVERDGDRLRIRRGLLQRRAASIPVSRVDGVAIVEGLLRAPFGLATLRIETAGYRREGTTERTLFPLVRVRDVPALLALLVPGLEGDDDPAFTRPPLRAARRYALRPALAGAAVGVVVLVAFPEAWPAVPALAILGVVQGLAAFRAAGLRLEPTRVVLRSRRFARVTLVARRHRLQESSVRRSFLQRRAALAGFGLALGSGRRGRVAHLEAATADAALASLRS